MTNFLLVTTTVAERDQAVNIAQELVRKRLAACVQVDGPITSAYRWNGAVETSDEWRCIAKVPATRFDEVSDEIRRMHAYDVPEIIGTPISRASQSYADWMTTETEAEIQSDRPPLENE